MLLRKTIFFFSAAVLSLMTSCTTRYQDMLRERDERIRELSGEVARLHGLNDQLSQTAPADAAATPKRDDSAGEVKNLQDKLGNEVNVSYRGNRLSIGVNDSVTFDSGSTELKESSHRVLKGVATALKGQYAGRRFYVEGHTDDDPIQKTKDKFTSNRHLSVMRADAVARFLIAQGVPESKIVIVGFGQFDPSANAKNKAQNRRVEIVIGDPTP